MNWTEKPTKLQEESYLNWNQFLIQKTCTKLKPCSLPTYKCGLLACTESLSSLCKFRAKHIRHIKTKGQRKPLSVSLSCSPGRTFIGKQVSYFSLGCLNFLDATFHTKPRPPAVGYCYDFLGTDQLLPSTLFYVYSGARNMKWCTEVRDSKPEEVGS